jgi:hypothetical protein
MGNDVYLVIIKFDPESFKMTETGIMDGTGIRRAGWVKLKSNPDFKEDTLVTISFSGLILFMDPKTGIQKTYDPVVEGQPNPVNTPTEGAKCGGGGHSDRPAAAGAGGSLRGRLSPRMRRTDVCLPCMSHRRPMPNDRDKPFHSTGFIVC